MANIWFARCRHIYKRFIVLPITRSSSKDQVSGDGRKISSSPERIVPDDIYMLLHEQVRIPLSRNYTVHRFLCLSLSKEKPSLGNSRNRTTPLFPRQTIDEHGTHDLDERPFLFYQKRFREKTTRRKEMAVQREEEEEERESIAEKRGRKMVSKDYLEGSWREPLGTELRGTWRWWMHVWGAPRARRSLLQRI